MDYWELEAWRQLYKTERYPYGKHDQGFNRWLVEKHLYQGETLWTLSSKPGERMEAPVDEQQV